jgi:hypothetical protein
MKTDMCDCVHCAVCSVFGFVIVLSFLDVLILYGSSGNQDLSPISISQSPSLVSLIFLLPFV